MSESLLQKIINEEIDLNTCIEWLQYDTSQESDADFPCSRLDFALYFISFLRSQTENVLQCTSIQHGFDVTPTKHPHHLVHNILVSENCTIIDNDKKTGATKTELSVKFTEPHQRSINICNENKASKRISTELFPISSEKSPTVSNISNNIFISPHLSEVNVKKSQSDIILSETESSLELSNNSLLSDEKNNLSSTILDSPNINSLPNSDFLLSPVTPISVNKVNQSHIQFSTPINNNLSSSINSQNTSFNKNSNKHSNQSKINHKLNSENISPNQISHHSSQRNQHNNQIIHYSKHNTSGQSGIKFHTPQNTPSSTKNNSNCDTSAHNSSTHRSYFSHYSNEQSHTSNPQSSQNRLNSSEKPTSSRTNICIGDFITSKSDKNSVKKKKHTKFINLSLEDNLFSKNNCFAVTEQKYNKSNTEINITDKQSFPDIDASKSNTKQESRRRINPTRLNVSSPTLHRSSNVNLSNDSQSFGIKFEKPEQHEAFKAPVFQPKELSKSFSTERNILKLEKEKLLEKFNTLNTSNGKYNKHSNSNVSLIKTPVKEITKPISKLQLITADPSKVTYIKMLDNLACLYSAILNLNIMTNIASDVSFLLSLVVSQQTILIENYQEPKNIDMFTNKSEYNNVNREKSSYNESNTKDIVDKQIERNDTLVCSEVKDDIEKKKERKLTDLFHTVHNCVYFALRTLLLQTSILNVILDKNTMRILGQNVRVQMFSPQLAEYLNAVYTLKQQNNDDLEPSSGILTKNVCFISETDNAENFHSEQSFFTFKKQRDLFYEILRTWERQHNSSGWSFVSKLGGMIRTLLGLSIGPSNAAHLARLFREQLIATCVGSAEKNENMPEIEWCGAGVSAQRLSKLTQRLTAAPTGTPLPKVGLPHFPDHQEFFRDFLVIADSSCFKQHLQDSIIQEICRLDQTIFPSSENDRAVLRETKLQYVQCVVSLQLLGKFLGLVMALPYRSQLVPVSSQESHRSGTQQNRNTILPIQGTAPKEKVLQSEMNVRDKTQPPINLLDILRSSEKNKRLILTIPWVVNLLSMLDYSSLRISYYRELIILLFHVYFSTNCLNSAILQPTYTQLQKEHPNEDGFSNKLNNSMISPNVKIFLKICLGWLFDMPHFPQDFFFSWIEENYSELLYKSIDEQKHCGNKSTKIQDANKDSSTCFDNNVVKTCPRDLLHFDSVMNKVEEEEKEIFPAMKSVKFTSDLNPVRITDSNDEVWLDYLDIIDGNVLLIICPHLKEFKGLLSNRNNFTSGNDRTYRHITPVTSSLPEDRVKQKQKQIQIELEEWFLRSQSTATSRAVRSVGERVGAALIRLVRTQIPLLKVLAEKGAFYIIQHEKVNIKLEITKLYNELVSTFKVRSKNAGRQCALLRSEAALRSLLPPSTSVPTLTMLSELCARKSISTLQEWLKNQVHIDLITMDIQANIDKLKSNGHFKNSCWQQKIQNGYEQVKQYLDTTNLSVNQENINKCSSTSDSNEHNSYNFVSGAAIIIELKDLCLHLVTGGSQSMDLNIVLKSLEECIDRAVISSKCSYIQYSTKRIIGQLSVDLVILTIALHPTIVTNAILEKFKILWKNCFQDSLSPEEMIHLSCNIDSKDASVNDEVIYFQNLMFGNTNEDGISKILDCNESLVAFENDNLCTNNIKLDKSNEEEVPRLMAVNDSLNLSMKESSNKISNEFFNTIFCARNVMFFGELGNGSTAVWKKLAEFLKYLLKNGFLTEDSLTEQCLAIYREDWPKKTLENLSTCMRELSQNHSLSSEKLQLFLDFLTEFCLNISEDCDFLD